jgi:outer membrane lipoprotein-sorting protein
MAPGAPGVPTNGQPPQALAQLQQAWGQVRTLSATYDLYEKGTKGTESANVKFYFKKPGDYRYEVSKHTSSIKNGSTSVFNTRTRQIKSRLGGALSFVPISGTLDDERSKSTRDYTLDQTDYATQTELFLKPGAQVTQRAPGVLELARPTMYPGVDTLRITLDAQRGLPTTFELVQGAQVVYRKRISGLVVNPSLASSKFTL